MNWENERKKKDKSDSSASESDSSSSTVDEYRRESKFDETESL